MALNKKIELDSGVVVNYHRVVSVNTITNLQNVIEVASYTSREKRSEEKNWNPSMPITSVFIDTNYFVAPYDQNMTIESSYHWVKENIERFADAEDVLD